MARTQTDKVHWTEMPDFHNIYMPWCDKVIKSDSVKKIIDRVKADQEAIANCGAVLLPKLDLLSTTVTIEMGGGGDPHEYEVRYNGSDEDPEEDYLVIGFGDGHHAFMLHPSRAEGYKIGMSIGLGRPFHPLLGSKSQSFSPYPLIEKAHLRADAEWTIDQVATALMPDAAASETS